ncbi:MAG: beta-hydroxyacyl-ACP dehydratase [Verrucomicrobia bacterium]|nr:beta-hydroxyacyl-ACP dehydratase [Verrucomicrobiota bacterium]
MNASDRTLDEALARLPHGPEFRFVDRLRALDPGHHGVGEYTVRPGEPWLRGHFPGDPLWPGVLLVEAAAQLAGVVAQSDPGRAPLPGLRLTALRALKLLGTARPGETIRLEARITGRLGVLVHATVTAQVNEQPVLNGELTLAGTEPRADSGQVRR